MQNQILLLLFGILVGMAASFSGLGGGFLMVPLLILLGYTAQKAVGTSFVAILAIAISALVAHNKLAHIDYRAGLLLGAGGVLGAQVGARLIDQVSTANFKKIFAIILLGLAGYLFWHK
ncbi:MAG: sulfite exporter TauE/SafE family protein [Thermodesulfobacteriota bacterium]